MTDPVERLRKRVAIAENESRFGDAEDMREAANEIERLMAANERLHHDGAAEMLRLRAEIERLRAALEAELKSKLLARQFSSVGMIGALENENARLREILRIIWVAYQDNDGIRKIFHEAGLPWPEWERMWKP